MRVSPVLSPPRIGVAIPRSQLYVELGQMISEVIVHLGYEPVAMTGEERRLADVDLLMIVGDGRKLSKLISQLEHARRRPKCLLWHMEPVLPPGISEGAEAQAGRVADCDWECLSAPWQRFWKAVVPARTEVQYARRAWCARGVRRELRNDGRTDFDGVDANSIYFAAAQFAWLKQMVERRVFDHVFTSALPRWQFLDSRHIETRFVPIGYHPGWAAQHQRQRTEDVVFIGKTRRTRRQAILRRLQSELADRGVGLRLVDRNCFGRDRAELLASTKILLTLAKFPWDHAGIRLMMGAASGTMVVSGPRGDAAPFRAGEHFVQCELSDLADAIIYYVQHDLERSRIVENMRQFAAREWTLQRSLAKILSVALAGASPLLQAA